MGVQGDEPELLDSIPHEGAHRVPRRGVVTTENYRRRLLDAHERLSHALVTTLPIRIIDVTVIDHRHVLR